MELEHLVDKLNEVVTDQADQLQELARKSAALREQVLRGDPGGKQDPLSEPPPPHY